MGTGDPSVPARAKSVLNHFRFVGSLRILKELYSLSSMPAVIIHPLCRRSPRRRVLEAPRLGSKGCFITE